MIMTAAQALALPDTQDGDLTAAAIKRRALIAAMSDEELAAAAQRHTNRQTLRFIADEQAQRVRP